MKVVDERTIRSYGIPGSVLMERAGLAVVSRIEEHFGPGGKALVIAGTGNNGGDGIMVARELRNRGYRPAVLIAGSREKLSPECRLQYKIASKFGVPIRFAYSPRAEDFHGAFVVDALLGTGLIKNVKGRLAGLIRQINSSGSPVISVDIPSGISADTGQLMGEAVRADITVTFGAAKRGHLLHPGADLCGRLHVHDIGFPRELLAGIRCNALSPDEAALLLPERPEYSHKGDYGHLLVVAGSEGKTGAALMTTSAALRTGAGLVTLSAPGALSELYQARVTEAMVLAVAPDDAKAFSGYSLEAILEFASESTTALAAGPGMGQNEETARMVMELVRHCPVPLVLDADGVNALGQGAASVIGKSRSPVLLTPHPGEFSRITGLSISAIEADRPSAAEAFARKSGAYVLLKGAPTVIAGPEGELFINTTGGPALAKAGTGDVLTGIVGALCANSMSPIEALVLGAYLHGLAGDLAAAEMGDSSVIASDVIARLPEALVSLSGESQ